MAGIETAEDLYGLPLEHFIAERTALAKALRADRRRDEAAEVSARRKPSVAAWAVNQLVRTQAKTIARLFEAGDDLADAQAAAAEGKRAAEQMRGAMRRQRDAIDQLVEAARGLLSQDGHPLSTQTLERVADTLRAASIDPDSREQVRSGCLTQELRFAGLGIGDLGGALAASLSSASPAAPPKRTPTPKTTQKSRATAKARHTTSAPADAKAKAEAQAEAEAEARAQAEAEARAQAEAEAEAQREKERKERLRQARRLEREARRAATRAEKELQAAQARRDEARAALDEAEARLAEATGNQARAAAALAEAETEVATAEDSPAGKDSRAGQRGG
jgi:hypothetical protein